MSDEQNTRPAPTSATLTITGLPDLDGSFVENLLDCAVTNVDTEWSDAQIAATRTVIESMVVALAMADQCGGTMDAETFVALVGAHVLERGAADS